MRHGLITSLAVIAVILTAPCFGQAGGAPGSQTAGTNFNGMGRGTMTQDEFNKLQDYADRAKRLSKDDKAAGKTLEQVLAEDKAAATALVKAMPLNCDVTDAIRFAEGPATYDGKTVQTHTYEAACSNGMGYFLIARDTLPPTGLTCFGVDATRKADLAAKRNPADACGLPGNTELKISAAKMLASAGISTCKVKGYQYQGQSAASRVEFDEVACDDGQGYMMLVALPGAQFPVRAQTCNQSAQRGLPCQLSGNGTVSTSPQAFRDALVKNKVVCDASDTSTRIIGQQANVKRYVVEFACWQYPRGLVAFIPVEDSKAPFETMDCPTAAKHGATCALPGNKH